MINPLTNFDNWFSSAIYSINIPTKLEGFYSTFESFLSNISQTGFLPDHLAYRTGSFIDDLNRQFCKAIVNKNETDDVKLPIMRQFLELFLKFSIYGIKSYDKSALNLAITILSDQNKSFYQATLRHSIYKSLCKRYVEFGAMMHINQKLNDSIQDLELYKMLITLVSALHAYDQNFNPVKYIKTSAYLLEKHIMTNKNSLNVEIFCSCIEEIRNALPNKPDIIVLFISKFLPLLTCFFSSQIMKQRLAAINEVSFLSSDKPFQKQIAIYFQDNIELIENLQFRTEYSKSIGNIISLIARFNGCTINTVKIMWDKRTYLDASELKSFYDMFLQFSNFEAGPILKTIIQFFFSLEHNSEWFDLLDSLLMNMKDRKDCVDYLNQIRSFLMKIIFPDLQDEKIISFENDIGNLELNQPITQEIVGRAKSSLLQMVTFGASESTFEKLVSLLSQNNNNFVLHLLNNFLSDDCKIKISPDVIFQTLEKSLDLLIASSLSYDGSNGPSEEIQNFVLQLCKFNKESLTLPQLEKIFSCYKVIYSSTERNGVTDLNGTNDVCELKTLDTHSNFPNFFKFLDNLSAEDAITPDHLEILLSRFQSSDKSFFKLIKHLIYKANDSNPLAAKVTHLPLNKEDLLWSFALTDSPRRLEFDKLLCQIYASNDGVELSDKDVINAFLDKWQLYYNHQMKLEQNPQLESFPVQTNQFNPTYQSFQSIQFSQPNQVYQMNQMYQVYQTDQSSIMNQSSTLFVPTSLPILIDILRLFIYTMESQSSRNFNYAHKYEPEIIEVTVYWLDQSNIKHFKVPPSTTIGSIIESIAKEKGIQISTPILFQHNLSTEKPLKRTQTVGIFAREQNNGKNEATFDLKYDKSRKVKLHERNARVSSEVIESPYIDDIFTYLLYKKNDYSAYNLFKLLPQYKKALDFKKVDLADPNLKLQYIFPFDHLCYFLYNLISLLIDTSEEMNIAKKLIQFKQLDSYLIDTIEFFIIGKEFKNLDDLSIELAKYFLNFFILVPPSQDDQNEKSSETRQRLFIILIKLSLNPSLFKMVNKAIDFQFPRKLQQFQFPKDFETIFKTMILNEEKKIRDFAVSQFQKINIPFSLFTDCLTEIGESISPEFLSSLTSHLNDQIINDPRFCETILKLLYSDSAHGSFLSNLLSLVLKMLQREMIDTKERSVLLDFLINRFITTNYNQNDRIAFETASKCLTLLSLEGNLILKKVLEEQNEKRKKPFHQFKIDGNQIKISKTNKVGLKNLGMTCYMNATLQQFYSIKPFRYSVMNYEGSNEFLKQLSILFQNMKYSKTKYVTTEGFVDNFYLMGVKVNPHVQQDATEFITSFFDLFQDIDQYKDLVDDFFRIIITNSKRGLDKNDDFVKDSIDPLYFFMLEVEKLHSMKEGFEHFIKPKYLTGSDGYRIEKDKYIDAVNYSVISRIPPFLIIQLKRFEYNQTINDKKKLCHYYEVLNEINIAKYTENKEVEAIYSLTGIVIHRGVAHGGHYISFIKSKKNGWLCFDDENVTEVSESEVMQQASGIETSNIAGYILFYRRENYYDIPCIDLKSKYVLPEERRIEIETLNEENLQQQLVCSSGYFELMKGLSTSVDSSYLEIVLKYSINTLPYAKMATESKEVYNSLATRLKSIQMKINADQFNDSLGCKLINYILDNEYLSSVLFECPVDRARKGIVKLIKGCFVASEKLIYDTNYTNFLIQFACEVFKMVPNCLFSYHNIDQLFNVLYYFVKKFPVIKELAETNWNDKIQDLFVNGISSFFAANPKLQINYVYRGMNLTHFLKFVCSFNLTNPNPNEPVFSDFFYLSVLTSATKPKAISLFTDKYFSRDQFISILQSQELINEDCSKLFSLMFHIVPDQAVHLAMTCEFKKASYPCKTEDIITLMAIVTCMHQDTIPNVIVKSCDEWMPIFLTDDNFVTRNNAVVCALYTVPCQTITKNSLLDLDMPQYINIPVDMEIKTRPVDDEIISRSQILLKCLLELVAPTLTKVMIEKSSKNKQKGKSNAYNSDDSKVINRACQFLQLLNELLLIVPSSFLNGIQWNSIIDLYLTICKTDNELFNEQSAIILSIINNFNIPLSFSDLLLSIGINLNTDTTKKTTSKPKFNFNNIHNFLPHFLSLINTRFPNIPLPEEDKYNFFNFFFENIAFAPLIKVSRCMNEIKSFVKQLCKISPSIVNELLQSKNIKKWETKNICTIIAICQFMNKKRILLPTVAQCFKDIVKAGIDANEVVLQAIERSKENAYNEDIIEKLCDQEKLNNKVKDALKNLIV